MVDSQKPSKRTGHIACRYKTQMLVWGGYRETRDPEQNRYLSGNELWLHDPFLELWDKKVCSGNGPRGTSGASGIVCRDTLYIFGGFTEEGNTNQLYKLNMNTLQWTFLSLTGSLPTPCDKMSGWVYNDTLYYYGGFGVPPSAGAPRQPDFQFIIDPTTPWHNQRGWNNQFVTFDTVKEEWMWPKYNGQCPVPRAAHAAAQVDDKVFIFGGRHRNTRMNDLHCLDLNSMTWSGNLNTHGPKPQGRSWHSFTAVNSEHLVLYGGFSQTEQPLSDCWIYHIRSYTWINVKLSLERPRLWHTACVGLEGEVLIFGGCTENILHAPNAMPDHSNEMIVLRFSPKTLFQLCVDKVIEYRSVLQPFWSALPPLVHSLLNVKCGRGHHTSLAGS